MICILLFTLFHNQVEVQSFRVCLLFGASRKGNNKKNERNARKHEETNEAAGQEDGNAKTKKEKRRKDFQVKSKQEKAVIG